MDFPGFLRNFTMAFIHSDGSSPFLQAMYIITSIDVMKFSPAFLKNSEYWLSGPGAVPVLSRNIADSTSSSVVISRP